MSLKYIAIDFDGVIHSYTTPWQAADVIPDAPVPGAFQFIVDCLDQSVGVAIFSTRNSQVGGIPAMRHWFLQHGMFGSHLDALDFPTEKPSRAVLFIDDRGFRFEGYFPSVDFVKRFKPWNK